MPISKVYIICNAYESGVGHGIEEDGLENPYSPGSDEYEAYDIGYAEGVGMKNETGFKRSRDRVSLKTPLVIACGGTGEKEIALLSTIKEIGFDEIIIADDRSEKIKEEIIKFEMPERVEPMPQDRRTPAQRCNYSTKFR